MKPYQFNLWPNGKPRALTLSYDDGRDHDRRLVEIFNRYGLRGTFHLNSPRLGSEGCLTQEEIKSLFEKHEVSAHSESHPHLTLLPNEHIVQEMLEDRKTLERLSGKMVRGMSYPYGTYDQRVISMLPACGIEYSRTTKSTGHFGLPAQYLEWHPTCHHKDRLLERMEDFFKIRMPALALMYVWGHSYEFPNDNNWELMEQFGILMSTRTDVWFATNIEIIDYLNALKQVKISVEGRQLFNPSRLDLWMTYDGEALKLPPGYSTF